MILATQKVSHCGTAPTPTGSTNIQIMRPIRLKGVPTHHVFLSYLNFCCLAKSPDKALVNATSNATKPADCNDRKYQAGQDQIDIPHACPRPAFLVH